MSCLTRCKGGGSRREASREKMGIAFFANSDATIKIERFSREQALCYCNILQMHTAPPLLLFVHTCHAIMGAKLVKGLGHHKGA
jgi:hypothetical protein